MVKTNDLSMISSEIIRSAIFEIVESQLESKNFNIHISLASKVGVNNFQSVVYRITYHKKNENNLSTMILKVAPDSDLQLAQFGIRAVFSREFHLYNVVLPCFQQFEKSKGVIASVNGFNVYPKCYKTIDIDCSECIFLEDLCPRKLAMIDKSTEEVTADHVELVMNELGRLHAISFALKDQQPDKFEHLVENMCEVFKRHEEPFVRQFYNKQAEYVFDVLSAKEDAHLLAKIKMLFEKDVVDIAAECLNTDTMGPATVICYGDSWQNNMMFRNNSNGKPIEVCFLDWQCSRHSSPIIDITYFMFGCTTKELRDTHYEKFLKTYHESLSTHIKRLGSDPEKLFSFELMQEHMHKYGRCGLILAITILLPLATARDDSVVDMEALADSTGKENENAAPVEIYFHQEHQKINFISVREM